VAGTKTVVEEVTVVLNGATAVIGVTVGSNAAGTSTVDTVSGIATVSAGRMALEVPVTSNTLELTLD
jgi:hypothetical protein